MEAASPPFSFSFFLLSWPGFRACLLHAGAPFICRSAQWRAQKSQHSARSTLLGNILPTAIWIRPHG